MNTITIKPLGPELLEDYLFFFDHMVFTENPGWSACYCFSFHFTGPGEQWTRENNRASVIRYITEKKMAGYLAYSGNTPVGWCNVNNRQNYAGLQNYYEITGQPDGNVVSVVCFLVHPDYRRKGIAQKMLEQICVDYSFPDFDYIEAYPGKDELSCERLYKGPLEMYKRFGFQIEKEYDSYMLVRKYLK